jgi:hypothetical protein
MRSSSCAWIVASRAVVGSSVSGFEERSIVGHPADSSRTTLDPVGMQ